MNCPHCQKAIENPPPPETKRFDCPSCGETIFLEGLAPLAATVLSKTQQATVVGEKSDPLVGRTMGGCQILAHIGRGAMGSVYKAKQLSLDRIVAFKTIRPEFCTDEQFLSRFRQEAKTVGRFSTPHIVQIHEVGFEQGFHFLIMEFVGGGNLWGFAASKPGRRLAAEDALRFLAQAAEGLYEAEKLQIVHRDVKPENLLLDSSGRVKVADFGIAKMLDSGIEMTMSAAILGTPLYMSPEQGLGRELDHRSDMYSLGASIYHLMTGVPPVKGDSVYECIRKKTEIACLSPASIVMDESIPGPLSVLIEKMTARDPQDRYASFADLLADIEKIRSGQRVSAGPSRGRGKLWTAAAGVLLLAGGALVFRQELFGEEKSPPEEKVVEQKSPATNPVLEIEKSPPDHQLAKALPVEKAPLQEPKMSAAEVESRIAEIREKIRTGDYAPYDDVKQLLVELPRLPQFAPYGKTLEALREDCSRKSELRQVALRLPGAMLADSARQLADQWEKGIGELQVSDDSGPELKSWVQARRRSRAKEYGARAVDLARKEFQRVEQSRNRFWEDRVGEDDYLRDVQDLENARKTLLASFPESASRVEESIPESSIQGFRAEVEKRRAAEGMTLANQIRGGLDKVEAAFSEKTPAVLLGDLQVLREKIPKGDAKLRPLLDQIEALAKDAEAKARMLGALQTIPATRDFGSLDELEANWDKVLGGLKLSESAGERLRAWRSEELARRGSEFEQAAERIAVEENKRLDAAEASFQGAKLSASAFQKELDSAENAVSRLARMFPDKKTRWTELISEATIRRGRSNVRERIESQGQALQAVQAAFVAGKLEEAGKGLASLGTDMRANPKFAALSAGLSATRQGFAALLQALDLDGAQKEFERARDELQGDFPDLVSYPARCLERLQELKKAVAGMARVPGAEAQILGEAAKPVAGFFLDRFEVSVKEYRGFLAQFVKGKDFSAQKQLWPGEDVYLDYREEPRYLAENPLIDESWPIEQVNYYQALAFLKAHRKDLPRFEEWWLAARGSGGNRKPWPGSFENTSPEDLRRSAERPVPVHKGGIVLGFAKPTVHHLSGNVAEWVHPREPGAGKTSLVGGRYVDTEEPEFSGDRWIEVELRESLVGAGFRGVVRPADFFADLLPAN